jgi:hypothetical protein
MKYHRIRETRTQTGEKTNKARGGELVIDVDALGYFFFFE